VYALSQEGKTLMATQEDKDKVHIRVAREVAAKATGCASLLVIIQRNIGEEATVAEVMGGGTAEDRLVAAHTLLCQVRDLERSEHELSDQDIERLDLIIAGLGAVCGIAAEVQIEASSEIMGGSKRSVN
jgi:hypothetical protein